MPLDLKSNIAQKTDEELYSILSSKNDYTVESIEIAEMELQNRDLDAIRISELEALTEKERKIKEIIAKEPLRRSLKIFLFLFPIGLIQFLLAEYYRNRGAERKYQTSWKCMSYGLMFYGLLFALTSWFSLTLIALGLILLRRFKQRFKTV